MRSFYRLKVLEVDGTYDYSNIESDHCLQIVPPPLPFLPLIG
jgi:hypothetical protein